MIKPTTTEIRSDTRINWVAYGYPDDTAGNALLTDEINEAWDYVGLAICRDLDALDANTALGRLAQRAVKLRLLQQSAQGQQAFISGSLSTLIKSFAVPGYSETRFDPGTKIESYLGYVNEWPVLADLLWRLMTPECRDALIALFKGENEPFAAIHEVDWLSPYRPYSWVDKPPYG